jgi:hypothetical protein
MAATSQRGTPVDKSPVAGQPSEIELRENTEASLGELISRTTTDLSQLFRDELELAKVEIKDEVKTAGRAGALMGAAGLLGYLALALLCFAAAWGLSEVMPEGFAFLIVGVVVGAVAGVVFLMGRKDLESFEPVPTQTVETIQEDIQWAKQLKS